MPSRSRPPTSSPGAAPTWRITRRRRRWCSARCRRPRPARSRNTRCASRRRRSGRDVDVAAAAPHPPTLRAGPSLSPLARGEGMHTDALPLPVNGERAGVRGSNHDRAAQLLRRRTRSRSSPARRAASALHLAEILGAGRGQGGAGGAPHRPACRSRPARRSAARGGDMPAGRLRRHQPDKHRRRADATAEDELGPLSVLVNNAGVVVVEAVLRAHRGGLGSRHRHQPQGRLADGARVRPAPRRAASAPGGSSTSPRCSASARSRGCRPISRPRPGCCI